MLQKENSQLWGKLNQFRSIFSNQNDLNNWLLLSAAVLGKKFANRNPYFLANSALYAIAGMIIPEDKETYRQYAEEFSNNFETAAQFAHPYLKNHLSEHETDVDAICLYAFANIFVEHDDNWANTMILVLLSVLEYESRGVPVDDCAILWAAITYLTGFEEVYNQENLDGASIEPVLFNPIPAEELPQKKVEHVSDYPVGDDLTEEFIVDYASDIATKLLAAGTQMTRGTITRTEPYTENETYYVEEQYTETEKVGFLGKKVREVTKTRKVPKTRIVQKERTTEIEVGYWLIGKGYYGVEDKPVGNQGRTCDEDYRYTYVLTEQGQLITMVEHESTLFFNDINGQRDTSIERETHRMTSQEMSYFNYEFPEWNDHSLGYAQVGRGPCAYNRAGNALYQKTNEGIYVKLQKLFE